MIHCRVSPLFPFSSASGHCTYSSFLDVPNEIKHALLFRMDYYTLAALMATCSEMATWRFDHTLFKRIIAEDINAEAAAARPDCSFRYYGTLLLQRWRCANMLVEELLRNELQVFGGWVRDMFAGPLLFRDIDVRAEGIVVSSLRREQRKLVSNKTNYLEKHEVLCPLSISATVTELSRTQPFFVLNETHAYNVPVTTYLVTCAMDGSAPPLFVSFRVQFIHDLPLVRDSDLDVNAFFLCRSYIRAMDGFVNRFGVWSRQLLDQHGIRDLQFFVNVETAARRKTIDYAETWRDDRPPVARSMTFSVKLLSQENTTARRHIETILKGCQRHVMMPTFPLSGTFAIVQPGKLYFDHMHSLVKSLTYCLDYGNSVVVLAQDNTITHFGRRYMLMQQRGWTLLTDLRKLPEHIIGTQHHYMLESAMDSVLEATKMRAFGNSAPRIRDRVERMCKGSSPSAQKKKKKRALSDAEEECGAKVPRCDDDNNTD